MMNYLPPVRHKSDYDGFYVDNSAIYVSKDDEKDWNCFLTQICRSIRKGYPNFQTRMCWKPSETGESIYVLMENPLFDLIADTGDKYTLYILLSLTPAKTPATPENISPRMQTISKRSCVSCIPDISENGSTDGLQSSSDRGGRTAILV